jgi:hypothetical protein
MNSPPPPFFPEKTKTKT